MDEAKTFGFIYLVYIITSTNECIYTYEDNTTNLIFTQRRSCGGGLGVGVILSEFLGWRSFFYVPLLLLARFFSSFWGREAKNLIIIINYIYYIISRNALFYNLLPGL